MNLSWVIAICYIILLYDHAYELRFIFCTLRKKTLLKTNIIDGNRMRRGLNIQQENINNIHQSFSL